MLDARETDLIQDIDCSKLDQVGFSLEGGYAGTRVVTCSPVSPFLQSILQATHTTVEEENLTYLKLF